MKLERFRELLDTQGTRLEAWPESLQQPARVLLETSSEAAEALRDAERLHEWLEQAPSVVPSQALMATVRALPARHPKRGFHEWWPYESVFKPALGLAMAAVLGLVTGGVVLPETSSEAESVTSAASSQNWEDLSGLAFAQDYASEQPALEAWP